MKLSWRTLGMGVLLAWTGLGLFAWSQVALHTAGSPETRSPATSEDGAALADELASLHEDLRALARALTANLQSLQDNLDSAQSERDAGRDARQRERDTRQGERSAALERELAALREELRGLREELSTLAAASSAPAAGEPVAGTHAEEQAPAAQSTPIEEPAAPSAISESAPAEPAKKKSFLAFSLPSDDFRFDERRTWTVLPALSRVGFDAKSTLHDFSGVTSHLSGELEVDPSRPTESPRARIHVEAATLDTGVEGRDQDMREHLAVDAHPELLFELERFEAQSVDAARMQVAGTASGSMTIRGVTKALSMPVKVSIDEARRLCVQGEVQLRLSDFGVSVPSKLGVISMEDEVKVWISLRLRASARG